MNEIQNLEDNVDAAIGMVGELAGFVERFESGTPSEKRLYGNMINSLGRRLRFINNSFPELLNSVSLSKKIPGDSKKDENVQKVRNRGYGSAGPGISIRGKDKDSFLKELDISESLIRKLKGREKKHKKKAHGYRKASFYGRLSNKVFLGMSENWVRRGTFKSLSLNLRRSNLDILTATYVSMMFFSILISVFAGLFLFVFLLFFQVGLDFPFFSLYEGGLLERALKVFWVALAVPVLTGVIFYFFPSAEKSSLAKRIDQELPFVVIHMASISGSGIEPSEIFKIIGTSKEYKYTNKEIKKILNQTNIYGYDLTTALRNIALATPSAKLAELLNGIGVTINSGGDINAFFEKRAESLLLEYRLEREKFTKTAETFMDIYISIVIAAPMILLMLLIMISVSGIQTGFSVNQLTIAIIGIVAIINILFLTFLHLKQPTY